MNKVVIMGRLTKDPEVRYTKDNQAIGTFTLAIDRGKSKDGEDLGADFPRVTCFGKTAENVERYTEKGSRLLVEGSIRTGSYTNKEGEKVYTTDVTAIRVEFIDWKQKEKTGFVAIEDNDLPF